MLLSHVLLNTKRMSLILPLAIQKKKSWVMPAEYGTSHSAPVLLRAESVSIVYFSWNIHTFLHCHSMNTCHCRSIHCLSFLLSLTVFSCTYPYINQKKSTVLHYLSFNLCFFLVWLTDWNPLPSLLFLGFELCDLLCEEHAENAAASGTGFITVKWKGNFWRKWSSTYKAPRN